MTQQDKFAAFRAPHTRPGAFVIPNPWDIGSARILAAHGFEAGADVLFAPGLRDLAAIRTVCSALKKPVNVVMEVPGGFR